MTPEPGAAEAPQNPIEPGGTSTDSAPPALPHETTLAPAQTAVEPAAAQPGDSEPDSQALETPISESAAGAEGPDEPDAEVIEPASEADQPGQQDAELAEPPLF